MSSTQHQLIEQCATRLRGIVEALDNIHDNTPHRWSTDLDDVHSSAESLLALINDQAPVRSEASFEEWLANELEGEDGQPVPAAVCDIALARRAFNHWPKLEQPAKVGGVRFSAGVSSRLVVEAAQRLYEFESTPEQEAERIERLQAFREQCFEPLGTEFSKVLSENLVELSSDAKPEQADEKPGDSILCYGCFAKGVGPDHFDEAGKCLAAQAEAERPEVDVTRILLDIVPGDGDGHEVYAKSVADVEAKLAADGDRIEDLELKLHAALARVAELERQEPVATVAKVPGEDWNSLDFHRDLQDMQPGTKLYAAPVAQAQHSVPDGASDLCRFLAKLYCELDGLRYSTAKLPAEQIADALIFKWPVLQGARNQLNIKRISEQPYDESKLHSAIAAMLAAAPGKEVPQAWLDVQAERRRQVEAEGWTPEHDDQHADGQMAVAAGYYALACGFPHERDIALGHVPQYWPWDARWWKPKDARSNLVRSCALALAEIERLDRACISQSPQPGATTASS
ncbi:hypothetical protein JEY43_08010 [Pseudomonas aeruginosa]|nr:hypothetical protein [Pseudomonas aeruginosa]